MPRKKNKTEELPVVETPVIEDIPAVEPESELPLGPTEETVTEDTVEAPTTPVEEVKPVNRAKPYWADESYWNGLTDEQKDKICKG